MKFSTLALASVFAVSLSGSVAFAQDEPGFGGHGNVVKYSNQGRV